jgi:serine/threonine protein kinase
MFVCSECGSSSPSSGPCATHGAPRVDAGSDALLGAQVGSYRIARVLGAGGMGTVYLGVHPQIESQVAIKVMAHGLATDPTVVARFFEEARASNVIAHDGVVRITDLAQLADGRPYIVMEHLSGQNLRAHLHARGRLPPAEAQGIIVRILETLQATHEAGVVHRDIKPANIFLTAAGEVKLLDFGIAKLKPNLRRYGDHTSTGVALGTPAYMAPEQILGAAVDARADVYAVGVVLYELVTGRRPFQGDDVELRHLDTEPPSPRALAPQVSEGMERVILRALDKSTVDRFQSAQAFRDALMGADAAMATTMGARPAHPLPPGLPAGPPAPLAPKRRWPLVVAGAAALGVTLAAGYGLRMVTAESKTESATPVETAANRPRVNAAPSTSTSSAPKASGTSSAAPLPKTPKELARHFGIRTASFDAVAFAPSALEVARSELDAAELTSFTAEKVRDDGTVDLDVSSVTYTILEVATGNCSSLEVSNKGVDFRKGVNLCIIHKAKLPRCKIATVLATARSDLAGRPEARYTHVDVGFMMSSERATEVWHVNFREPGKEEVLHSMPDDGLCVPLER